MAGQSQGGALLAINIPMFKHVIVEGGRESGVVKYFLFIFYENSMPKVPFIRTEFLNFNSKFRKIKQLKYWELGVINV